MYHNVAVVVLSTIKEEDIYLTNNNDFIEEVYEMSCVIYSDTGDIRDRLHAYIRPLLNPHFRESFLEENSISKETEFFDNISGAMETLAEFCNEYNVMYLFVQDDNAKHLLSRDKKLFSTKVKELLEKIVTVNNENNDEYIIDDEREVISYLFNSDIHKEYLNKLASQNLLDRVENYHSITEKLLSKELTFDKDMLSYSFESALDFINFKNYLLASFKRDLYSGDEIIDLLVLVQDVLNHIKLDDKRKEKYNIFEIKEKVFGGYIDGIRNNKRGIKK